MYVPTVRGTMKRTDPCGLGYRVEAEVLESDVSILNPGSATCCIWNSSSTSHVVLRYDLDTPPTVRWGLCPLFLTMGGFVTHL